MKAINYKTPTISKVRKVLASLPYLIMVGIAAKTWYKFYNNEYNPWAVHYITLILIVVNGMLILFRFKPGLLMTGCILLLAGFGLLFFQTYISASVTLSGIITIPFEGWSFLLFVFYFAINCDILVNWYIDAKQAKSIDKVK